MVGWDPRRLRKRFGHVLGTPRSGTARCWNAPRRTSPTARSRWRATTWTSCWPEDSSYPRVQEALAILPPARRT